MKFIVDMPLSPGLAAWLCAQGHDAVHASDAGLACAPDDAILEMAGKEQRVVITADLDFPRLLVFTGKGGTGLILYRGGNYSERESVDRLKQPVTMRLDRDTVAYFKALSEESGIPYQTLINLYLRDCAMRERKLEMTWAPKGTRHARKIPARGQEMT